MESLVPCPAWGATIEAWYAALAPSRSSSFASWSSGVIVGLGTAWLAWLAPSFSRAASSLATLALLCAAGWSLMLAGAGTLWRQGPRRKGVAYLAAGFGWFISEWVNPVSAPAIIFTLGLLAGERVARPACPRRARRGQDRRLRVERVDWCWPSPTSQASACSGSCRHWRSIPSRPDARCVRTTCSRLQATRGSSPLRHAWASGSRRLGFSAALALIVWGLVRASAIGRRRTAAVHVPAAVALAAAALAGVYSIPRGLVSNDPVDTALWSVAAIALVAVGAGEAAGWLRRRQTRQRVARLALELAAAPAAGELAPALGRELGDPTFEVLYPLDDGRLVDAAGVARVVPADDQSQNHRGSTWWRPGRGAGPPGRPGIRRGTHCRRGGRGAPRTRERAIARPKPGTLDRTTEIADADRLGRGCRASTA